MPTSVVYVRPVIVSHGQSRGASTDDYIIAGCIAGSIFLTCILCTICLLCKWRNKAKEQAINYYFTPRIEVRRSLERIEGIVGPFLDANPHVLDMSDRKIPAFLKENIPNLKDEDAEEALYVIAKRRLAIPADNV
jgi:hypothetical protein